MSHNTKMNDRDRYREMLQRSLLTSGWEKIFDAHRFSEWVQNNRERLSERARIILGDKGSHAYGIRVAEVFERFVPRTQYDLPTTDPIFRPLFDAILECAHAIGLPPIRAVELVTSTSVSPSPFARPTSEVHQLFIGLGTSMFCNYWAKAFAAVVAAIGAEGPPFPKITSPADLDVHLSRDSPGLLLATHLALYHATTGTLIGFGEVEEPVGSYLYRTQVLSAMEVFVISHEYAHFVAEERGLEFVDESGKPSPKTLELFCDELGLQLSREWGSRHENWLAFTGVGAIVLFSALELCETCVLARNVSKAGESDGGSHPATLERLRHIVNWTTDKTADDQKDAVREFLNEYVVICEAVSARVLNIVSGTFTAR